MNSQIRGLKIASFIFGLVCLAQLLRLVFRGRSADRGKSGATLGERACVRDPGRSKFLDVPARSRRKPVSA